MKKGFATSAILYTMLLLFIILLVNILNNLQNKRVILDTLKKDTVSALQSGTILNPIKEPTFLVSNNEWTNQDVEVTIKYDGVGKKRFETTVGTTSNKVVKKCNRIENIYTCEEPTTTIEANTWYETETDITLKVATNGVIVATLENDLKTKSSSITIGNIDKVEPTIEFIKSGTDLYTDYNFTNGMNQMDVYNGLINENVKLSRIEMETPVGSYAVKITTNGEAWPYLGGFHQATLSKPDNNYIHRVIAKIPVGYELNYHTNAVGTEAQFNWLTSHEGTGEWEEYIYTLKSGSTGDFGTFGYLAVYPNEGSDATSVTWYVASARLINATMGGKTLIMQVKDNESGLLEYGCNQSETIEPNYKKLNGNKEHIVCETDVGNYYLWLKDKAGNKTTLSLGTGYSGTMIYTDPTFAEGDNSVIRYYNYSIGEYTKTREVMLSPVGSYGITLHRGQGETKPAYGGWAQVTKTNASDTYLHHIIAKFPVGYQIQENGNNVINTSVKWLTSQEGTGKWEEYIYETKTGLTGTISEIGFIYLSDLGLEDPHRTEPVTAPELTWQVAYATMVNVTDPGSTYIFVLNKELK